MIFQSKHCSFSSLLGDVLARYFSPLAIQIEKLVYTFFLVFNEHLCQSQLRLKINEFIVQML